MIDLNLFDITKEPELYEAVLLFNKKYQNDPDNIASYSYYKLWNETQRTIPLNIWKEFQLDKRVRSWYSSELELSIATNIQTLAKNSAKDQNYAKQQTLASLLNYQKDKTEEQSNKIFIYSFIPLTSIEEHLPNVKIIKTIPKELADAITVYEGNSEKER